MHIPLEEETSILLFIGLTFMVVLSLCILIMWWVKNQKIRIGITWLIIHFIFLYVSLITGLTILNYDLKEPMASENISMILGAAGVVWAISILFLLKGIHTLLYLRN